jgi:DNA-binding transcriptional MerR regulator
MTDLFIDARRIDHDGTRRVVAAGRVERQEAAADPVPETSLLGSKEFIRLAGINYSRLETFRRRGFIRPAGSPGTGHDREWSPDLIPVARLAARLSDAGLRLTAAEKVIGSGRSRTEIGPGIWIVVDGASVAEDIARAIEKSVCEPGEQCAERFCPDCTRYRQAQADAATARRIGGAP